MAKTREYEDALRELEQMHADGTIDQARYEVHRAKLLGELQNPHAGDLRRVVMIIVWTVLVIVALIIAGQISNLIVHM